MSLEPDDQDRGELSQPVLERQQSSETRTGIHAPASDARRASLRARAPLQQERPGQSYVTEVPRPHEDLPVEQNRARGDKQCPGFLRRHPLAFLLGLFLLIPALAASYLFWDYARHFESTDDAFIAARQFSIAPKVSGYITAVPVTDNQHVAAGDVIARIDDRDYRIALDQAQAQMAVAQANIQNIDAQISVQQAQISSNQAQVDQAQAGLVFAQQQAARYQDLAQKGSGTVQNAQQYASQLRQQQAALASAEANLELAKRQVDALQAQRKSANASLAQAKAQRDQAQLNLAYTTVTAAQPGRVVNVAPQSVNSHSREPR
jgi:membrane fusion protein, multidrug efflux system